MSEPASHPTRFNDVVKFFAIGLAILTFIGAAVTVGGVLITVLYQYFNLQRDTADNKASISKVEAKFDVAVESLKKQQADGQEAVLKAIREGLEKQSREFGEYAKKADGRMADAEGETRRIDRDGTNYGKTKVDTRMQEIAEVKGRVEKVESNFGKQLDDLRPIIQRTGDRVEQMWGSYVSQGAVTPPLIDARRPPPRR